MRACAGSRDAIARVRTPVPAAVSKPSRGATLEVLGEVARVRLEDEGNQEPIVGFRDRSRELLVSRRHGAPPSNDALVWWI